MPETSARLWRLQERAAPYLFVLPFVLLFVVFLLYPLTRSFTISFYKTAGPRHQKFVGVGNYWFLIRHDPVFWLAVANTLAYTIAFLAVQIPASLGLAILLNDPRIRFRNVFRFAMFSSHLVGQVFVAVIFYALFRDSGLVNNAISKLAFHKVVIQWLTTPAWVLPAVLIAGWWLSIGYGMVYFLAALQAVDRELYDAAAVDGASPWGRFCHVTLPGIRPVLAYVVLVGTIGAFQLFELPYVLLQGPGPGYRGLTIVMYLFSAGFDTGDLGYAAAIGWLLVLILLVIALAQIRLNKGVTES
jgi:ABC-type sugar transport system permease subunit